MPLRDRLSELLSSSWFRTVVAALLVAAILWYVPSGHILTVPGSAVDVGPMVMGELDEGTGHVMLTTVVHREANLLFWLYGTVHPRARLRPLEMYVRPDETFEDYLDRSREEMHQSQQTAKYVALDSVGYPVEVSGEGVEVVSVREESPAAGLLKAGDLIIEVSGETTEITEQLQRVIGKHQPGDEITVVVLRDEEKLDFTFPLMENPEEEGKGFIGIGILTHNMQFSFPIDVTVDAGAIGGPSAGLTFVLEMVDRLMPESDLLEGRKIACTGTVNINGKVGAVGGVTMKTWAAENAGADVFIVPKENHDDALEARADIKIVAVSSVSEAIEFLQQSKLGRTRLPAREFDRPAAA